MYFDKDNNYFDDYIIIDELNDKDNNYYFNFDVDNVNINRNSTLTTYENGFNKGNIFDNLYSQYKNHVYKLKVTNEKDKSLYRIQMYTFALKDMNLYLDVHPTDQSIIDTFLKTKRLLEEEKEKYENNYGPLCLMSANEEEKWSWNNNPWPWDKGGNK